MDNIVEQLRAVDHTSVEDCFLLSPLFEHAANEIERLRERCEAYKGQVEAGSIEIERLWADNDYLLETLERVASHGDRNVTAESAEQLLASAIGTAKDAITIRSEFKTKKAAPG